MIEMVLIFVLLLYVLPVTVCVVWAKIWDEPITHHSFIPIINMAYTIIYFSILIVSIFALIIECFPTFIYNYKKILNDRWRK